MNHKSRVQIFILSVFCLTGFLQSVFATPGDFDLTFSQTGLIREIVGDGGTASVRATAIQTDGKIISVGNTQYGYTNVCALTRHNTDGSLDFSFDGDGKTLVRIGESSQCYGVTIQTDGKILIVGNSTNNSLSDFALARLNANGSLDLTFDSDGKVITPVLPNNDYGFSVAVQPDGKIIAVGYSNNGGVDNNANADFAVVRYNSDGSLDNSFDGDGKISVDFSGSYDYAYGVSVQTDGKIVAAGVTYSGTYSDFGIIRFNQSGSLDNSFDGDGKVTTVVPNSYDIPDGVEIQPNGKIIVAGTTSNGMNENFALVRYNTDGSSDNSYGINGRIVYDLNRNDTLRSFTFDRNGKTVVAAESGGLFTVARLTGDLVPNTKTPFDFDGDGKTDIGIFRQSAGEWWINSISTNITGAVQFGSAPDKLVPGDYTGDGKADIAFWRPSTGQWFILRSEDFSFYAFPFGSIGDISVPADYDADGKTDVAVFRPSTSTWYFQKSSGGIDFILFGSNNDKPVAADYDGDGKADIAINRTNGGNREWWIRRSSDDQVFTATFGESTDKAVPGDYTGDGKADIAFFRPSNGFWYILRSENSSFYSFQFGLNGDVPTPGDYDGDGKTDAAVFRSSSSVWYLQRSTQGFTAMQFGIGSDVPVPSAFVP